MARRSFSKFTPTLIIGGIIAISLNLYFIIVLNVKIPSTLFLIVTIAIFFIQLVSILFAVYMFYNKPLLNLEYVIKKFLVGNISDEELHFKKTANPHLDYVLLFFGKTLHTLKNIKSEFMHGKEIKTEVNLAGEIQEKLLRKKLPEVPYLEIIAQSKPAGEIGGDSFDVIQQGDNYYIYVGDATGHGVGAGFIMMMVNALVSGFAKVTNKGNHILALTNDIIKPRVKANLLMSLLLVRWNASEKRMYMTGAGHEYLMIYKHSKKKCFKIKSGGIALGMTKNIHKLLKEREISFEPNDVIILYSDGITEAINQPQRDGNEEMFGEQRLVEAIEDAPNIGMSQIKTAKSIFRNISIHLSKYMGYKHIQLDDITLTTIQYKSDDYIESEDISEIMNEDFITEWSW